MTKMMRPPGRLLALQVSFFNNKEPSLYNDAFFQIPKGLGLYDFDSSSPFFLAFLHTHPHKAISLANFGEG